MVNLAKCVLFIFSYPGLNLQVLPEPPIFDGFPDNLSRDLLNYWATLHIKFLVVSPNCNHMILAFSKALAYTCHMIRRLTSKDCQGSGLTKVAQR